MKGTASIHQHTSGVPVATLQWQVEQIIRRLRGEGDLIAFWVRGLLWSPLIVQVLPWAAACDVHLPCPVAEGVWLCGCGGPGEGNWHARCWGLWSLQGLSPHQHSKILCFLTINKKKREGSWALTDSVSMAKGILALFCESESCLVSVVCSAVLHAP